MYANKFNEDIKIFMDNQQYKYICKLHNKKDTKTYLNGLIRTAMRVN